MLRKNFKSLQKSISLQKIATDVQKTWYFSYYELTAQWGAIALAAPPGYLQSYCVCALIGRVYARDR